MWIALGLLWLVKSSQNQKKSPPLKEPSETFRDPTRTLKAWPSMCAPHTATSNLVFRWGSEAKVGTHQGKKGSTDMLIFGGPDLWCDVWKKHDTLGFLNYLPLNYITASKHIQRGTRSISTISLKWEASGFYMYKKSLFVVQACVHSQPVVLT